MRYRIHRCSRHKHSTDVKLMSGEVVKADVTTTEVELVPVDHAGSTVQLRFVGASADAARNDFPEGALAEGTFASVKE